MAKPYFWQNPVEALRKNPKPGASDLTEKTRTDYEAEVIGPGKFGGEHPYVPYFYDVMTHGFVDEEASYPEGGGWVGIFEVDEEAIRMFPELKGKRGQAARKKVAIYERSDGIVEEIDLKSARYMIKEMQEAEVED